MDTLLTDLIVDLRTTAAGDHHRQTRTKGLHSFQEADAADFFGREALVSRLLRAPERNG